MTGASTTLKQVDLVVVGDADRVGNFLKAPSPPVTTPAAPFTKRLVAGVTLADTRAVEPDSVIVPHGGTT